VLRSFHSRVTGPLFILGAPRSGTSLLYRALALHPQAAWINNYNRRLTALPEVAVLNRLGRRSPQVRRRVWFGEDGDNAYRYDQRRSLFERFFPQPVEGEPLFERRRVVQDPPDSVPDAEQLLLRADLERLTAAAGGGTLISKRIGHNRRVQLLASIFPDSKFVVMSRDGRAVAKSLLSVDWWSDTDIWWWGGTPMDWARDGGDPLELAAKHWVHEVEAIEEGLVGISSRRVLRVSYEALVRSPIDVLTGTAVFGGLGVDPEWQEELAHVRFPDKNRLGPRSEPDPRVGEIQSGTLRALGYPA
jgi:hypothetical protein